VYKPYMAIYMKC